MEQAVKLLPLQIADELLIPDPIDLWIEMAGEKTPDKGQAADQPGSLKHAKQTPGQGKEGVAADGVRTLGPK